MRNLFRAVQSYIVAAAVIATSAALVFAIYFTQAGLPWAAFLTGILVAAILAEAARSSRAEWGLIRRSAQVSMLKEKLEHEAQLRKIAEQKLASDKSRLQLLDDVLLTMVALFDAEGHCRYHNHAFRNWLKLRPELINGKHLREIFSAKDYAEIATAVRQSLDGQSVQYEHMQQLQNGSVYHLSVSHIPQIDHTGKVTGFFFLAEDITAPGDLAHSNHPGLGSHVPAHQPEITSNRTEHFDHGASGAAPVSTQNEAGKGVISAIQKGQFSLYCQLITPLIDSHKAEHYEILIRLIEEEERMLPPGAFFPLAEKQGLMPFLDRWVVQHVLEWASNQKQRQLRHEGSIFFINLAAATISDPEFPEFLRTTVNEYGMPAEILCFEVPYSELAAHGQGVAEFIRAVRQSGCRVALCGFGRESVSLDLIRDIRLEYLKIDGNTILNMLRSPSDLAKVISINRVAKQIGVSTVAELVENEEIIAKLRELRIDFAQGFGISRPRKLEE